MIAALAALTLAAVVGAANTHTSEPIRAARGVRADSCDSVFFWSRVGWAEQEYKGSLRQWDSTVPFPPAHLMMTLNEVGPRIRFDGPLDLNVLAEHGAKKIEYDFMPVDGIGTFGAHGLYGFSYEADGKLTHPRVLVSSLSERVDSALIRAVRAASDSGNLLPLTGSTAANSVELRLTLGTWLRRDSLAATGVLFRVRQPAFDQVTYPQIDQRKSPVPTYPSDALAAGMDGEVDVEIVVRADGSVDPTSILIPRATATPFARHVVDAVMKSRFSPARVGGCPVPALVTQPYAFTIKR